MLIVDDHRAFAQAVTMVLEYAAKDMEVAGVAHSVRSAIEVASRVRPDVVVMDLRLPDGNGLEAAAAIRHDLPDVKILMLTAEEGTDAMAAALNSGIHGYLIKTADIDAVTAGIRRVHEGNLYFDPRASSTIVEWANQPAPLQGVETDVLRLVATGMRNQDIASDLAMSLPTVKRVLQRAANKLGTKNRASTATEASRRGLI